jgi:RNA polymerase-binding transcription factor DksA
MLAKEKIEYFKKKLEEKKAYLEKQMENIAHPNLNAPGDWEPTAPDMNSMPSDPNELADTFEELENVAAVEENFEEDLDLIVDALDRIKKGKYGICEEGGEEIEEARLEANPAARYCIKHTKNR